MSKTKELIEDLRENEKELLTPDFDEYEEYLFYKNGEQRIINVE